MKKLLIALLLTSSLAFSATANNDPLEGLNRVFFSFNQTLDEVFIKPAAKGYEKMVPSFFKDRLGDFFSNLGDVATGANQLLQFRFDEGFETVGRVAVNSTVGLGGLFDVASEMNLQKGDEDFGQTMGTWGISQGPYLVLPFFGSTTLRDLTGTVADAKLDASMFDGLDGVEKRTLSALDVLSAEKDKTQVSVSFASDDAYVVQRQLYFSEREMAILDGLPAVSSE
ncbi:MAG: VacJ family lipoprotein [Gammaproteobacteria bacterium]|nr:VacJ family lipoprotein [Gammaproteobacteria bacterium]